MNQLSLCTIYANRKTHLYNLIEGLKASNSSFNELVIVTMNDELPPLPDRTFPIKTSTIKTKNNFLPLAAARNKAAEIATGSKLIFLDVDCIPAPDMVENYARHLRQEDALYQGSVRYLNANWQQDWTYATLFQQSAPHRLQGKEVKKSDRLSHPYELFWSLSFGIRKQTFSDLGGFDPRYIGYGGEDTDFSFTARSQNLPLYKISALAYHQFHPSYNPPLNHLAEIVSNAEIFQQKWLILPMDKWLKQFANLGYIEQNGARLEILRYPTKSEIAACLKEY